MISAGDFRNGITIEYEGNIYQIMEFQHVKPGKGAAFVRTKLKDIQNGGVIERTFRPTESFPRHASTGRICSIFIMTEICIISWIRKAMSRSSFHPLMWVIP